MILATPIFYPIITQLGYDPIWAGIMIAFTVVIGGNIPPVAMTVFIVKDVTGSPIGLICSGVYPFLISMIRCVILLFLFPGLVTYLPSVMMK
jgi:TRAP-type C4-dicarboxylate transport system permease large subunit